MPKNRLTTEPPEVHTDASSVVRKFVHIMADTRERRVNLKVEIPKSLDRAIEAEVYKRDATKRQVVEDLLRAALRKPERVGA